MGLSHRDIRERFRQFYVKTGHKEVPAIPLVPQNDPTTLFTGSGMQQFVPNLLGEPHPQGSRLFNIQPCFRAQDIEEVGDNRHDTFFEMIGNWSLGDYFKKEQLDRLFHFLIDEKEGLGLDPARLFVTTFKGEGPLPKDSESVSIWKELFAKVGITAAMGNRIVEYGSDKNWWSRAGAPQNMPPGEPGGPDSEVFFDFGPEHKFHESSRWKDLPCHPNCDCGRYMEIANSVFMEYKKEPDGSFSELPRKNVDFGGGMERFAAVSRNTPDIFTTDLYLDIIRKIETATERSYQEKKNTPLMRVIADHLKAATFIIAAGIEPSNKEQGYILRRLIRRSALKMHFLDPEVSLSPEIYTKITETVVNIYKDIYFEESDKQKIATAVTNEIGRFSKTLNMGLREIQKVKTITGKIAFDLYQSYGFPMEMTEELFLEKGQSLDKNQFRKEFEKHRNLSRTASVGKFKGGLADHSQQVVKYHTATHLLHQALFDVLGDDVRQEGSNITGERLRFDFSTGVKPAEGQIRKVENIIREKIKDSLPVQHQIMLKEKAYEIGARSFFREKYPENVKVYFIGKDLERAYSKEFCGGPHVTNTSEIGLLTIYKWEKIGSNVYRIYAK